ncbi:MAG: OmpA family protein [Flavipsychrobacter sp.]
MSRRTFLPLLPALFTLLFIHSYSINAQDTIRLYYHLDDPKLNTVSTHQLDSLVYHRIIEDGKKIIIVGYADYLGSSSYNALLSKKRANSVKQHLLNIGLNTKNIVLCEGKGEIPRDNEVPEGFAPDRRVDVVLNSEKAQPIVVKKASIKPVDIKPSTENTIKDQLKDVAVGETFVLKNIYFYAGRHTVRESSLEELGLLYEALEANPNIHVQIEGHVCCIRPTAPDALDEGTFELALSVNRAKAIYHYLIAEGIEKERLKYVGFGKRRPAVAEEKTPEDANKNRRVEIRVLKK